MTPHDLRKDLPSQAVIGQGERFDGGKLRAGPVPFKLAEVPSTPTIVQ